MVVGAASECDFILANYLIELPRQPKLKENYRVATPACFLIGIVGIDFKIFIRD